MKSLITCLAFSAIVIAPAHAAKPFKDFAGTKCTEAELVTITKVDTVPFASGPMKGYVHVTVALPAEETSTAPIPASLAKKLKAGDKACKATFVDMN